MTLTFPVLMTRSFFSFFSASKTIPYSESPSQTSLRTSREFSPMPPVKTIASTAPRAAM